MFSCEIINLIVNWKALIPFLLVSFFLLLKTKKCAGSFWLPKGQDLEPFPLTTLFSNNQLMYTLSIPPINQNPFSIVTGDKLVSGFNDKYKAHSLFIVSRPSVNIEFSIQGLLIVMGNPIGNAYFDTVKHNWISTVWPWTNRKHFLLARGNIWNPKVAFYNKSSACWARIFQ